MYNISMDCTVRKQEFRNDKVSESEWCGKAYALSEGLARIVGGDAREWYSRIMTKRQKNQPYLKIADLVDYDTMKQLIELPLFNEGKFKGGIQIETVDTRKYPYGSLGRRAIGVVANNRQKTRITGLEEKCNRELHGEEGYAKMTYTDRKGTYVPVSGWKSKKARNGLDVKSTLDMDIQDLADRSLRELMAGNPHITHGCFLIMDVESGAIRAMVNLKKASDGNMGEVYNYAVTTANNPGSVFKVATLMAALDEGLISLSDSIPCMDGRYVYKNIKCPLDKHATKDHYPSGYIGVEEGLKISSNHVFRYIGGVRHQRPRQMLGQGPLQFRRGSHPTYDCDGLRYGNHAGAPALLLQCHSQWRKADETVYDRFLYEGGRDGQEVRAAGAQPFDMQEVHRRQPDQGPAQGDGRNGRHGLLGLPRSKMPCGRKNRDRFHCLQE